MLIFFKKKWVDLLNWFGKASQKPIFPSLTNHTKDEHTVCSMLCIDDDKSFCLFIQQLASSFGLQMDVVNSIREAKEMIEANKGYKAFIVDGHLPDGSGFELIAWIREKMNLSIPIVFISRIYQDAISFRLLMENLKVNFVLEKPIQPREMHQLFVQLCELISFQNDPQGEFSDALLLGLKKSYQKTIPDKIERLEKMILGTQKNPTLERLQILKKEVHKIGGSAGSYGYMAVTDLCRKLECELIKLIQLSKKEELNQAFVQSLDDFFTNVKLHFQMRMPESDSQSSCKTGFLASLFMVDTDTELSNHLTQSIKNLDFEFIKESDPQRAIPLLMSLDFYPEILFFNAKYPSSALSGYDLIKEYYRHFDHLTNVMALMVEDKSVKAQAEALRRGMLVTIAKPFQSSPLLAILEEIPFRPFPISFKVIVVDDDPDICQYIRKALKFFCLDVRVLHDISLLQKQVEKEAPDLILIDINLAEGPIVHVLQQLREDLGDHHFIIGMLAIDHHNSHLIQECYEEGVHELLFKPLERGALQRKVAHLLQKRCHDKLSLTKDLLFKWVTPQVLQEYLKILCQESHHLPLKMLVLFEIEGVLEVSLEMKAQVIESVSQSLDNLLHKHEMAAHLKDDKFALVFQGYDPNFVQLFMRRFLEQIYAELSMHLLKEPFRIHEALLLIKEGCQEGEVMQKGEEMLSRSRQLTHSTICLFTDPTFSPIKEVFIFDDSGQNFAFLQTTFEEKGFVFRLNVDVESVFQPRDIQPLFVLGGSFAAAKAKELIKKVMKQSAVQIPLLQLPSLSSGESLEALLNEVDYFEAPFGLIILLSQG